jgi:hypothetical protein
LEQLERRGGLNELDREELRNEYRQSAGSSPTHSDPDTAPRREYNQLFRRPDSDSQPQTQTQQSDSIPQNSNSSLYSVEGGNDSTDTIRPGNNNINTSNLEDLPFGRGYSYELDETHTYPPLPRRVPRPRRDPTGRNPLSRILSRIPRFSELSNQPFAEGSSDNINSSSAQAPNSESNDSTNSSTVQATETNDNNMNPSPIQVDRGSLLLSSQFLDNFNDG